LGSDEEKKKSADTDRWISDYKERPGQVTLTERGNGVLFQKKGNGGIFQTSIREVSASMKTELQEGGYAIVRAEDKQGTDKKRRAQTSRGHTNPRMSIGGGRLVIALV